MSHPGPFIHQRHQTKDTFMVTRNMTQAETEVYDLTNQIMVEERVGIAEASLHALAALPHPDPAFVLWLSGNTVARIGTRLVQIDEVDYLRPGLDLAP